jgi:uncharacterized coiled-coil DUF342 family protein
MAKETSNFANKQELQDYLNSLKQIDAQYRELNKQAKELANVPGNARENIKGQLKALRLQYDTHKEILASIKQAESELKSFTKETEKAAKALEGQNKAVEDLTDNFSELNTFQRSITRQYGEQSDETRRINKQVDSIKATVGGIGKFLKKNNNLEEDQRDALMEASDYLKSMPSSFDRLNKQVNKGTLNQKNYNKYVSELNDNWEEILDKINDSHGGLRGMKKSLRGMGNALNLNSEASQAYKQYTEKENQQKASSVISGAALSGLPGGEGMNQLIEARYAKQMGYSQDTRKLKGTIAGAAIGAGVTDFVMSMRAYIPALQKQYYRLANFYAPQLAGAQGEVNIQQAIFNRDAKLFGGPLSKKYGKGMFYAAEASKNFDFQMQSLTNEFNKASKTAFFGHGIGSVGYNAGQLQLAGIGAESVASAMTDIATGANVNFFGTTLGTQAAVFSKEMGVSTQSIGEIMAAFRRMDGSSGKTALNLTYSAAKMADMKQLNPSVILQDMAEASSKLLSYNIQNKDAFIQQAIAIRQMGGSLPKFAQGITSSVLNYRESMQAQISLSNMLNRSVDFSVAQSLAYQGKYAEAYQNIQQSGVLQAVRSAGPLAANQFSQIFGMGIDDFQAKAESQGKGLGLKSSLNAENKSFLGSVAGAEKAGMVGEARIQVTKAVFDEQFAKTLATGLNSDKAYLEAVNNFDALNVASQKLQSTINAIVTGLGAAAGAYLGGRLMRGGAAAVGNVAAATATASGKFAGYKMAGTGANAMLQRPNGQFASAAERAEYDAANGLSKAGKLGKFGGKALGILGIGLDAYSRMSSGQSVGQTVAGVGAGAAGGWASAQLGATAGLAFGPGAVVASPVLGLLGGIGGYMGGGYLADKLTGVGQPKVAPPTPEMQNAIDESSQMLTVMKNIELIVADIAGYQANPATVQLVMDGKDISNSLIKHQMNNKGVSKQTTLRQSLGWYK